MSDLIFLRTGRLTLRGFHEDDARLLQELDSDPEVLRYVGEPMAANLDGYRALIRDVWVPRYEETGLGCFAAVGADGVFLGWIFLREATDARYAAALGYEPGELELGYRFRRDAWGKGYATEGSSALIEAAFTRFGAERVVAAALAENRGSTRVMEKAGMALVPGDFRFPDHDGPAVKYAVTRSDWSSRRGRTSG